MIHTFTRHQRMTYRDTQEAWNRECHSDALREMQLVPAETPVTRPSIVGTHAWTVVPMAGALAFVITVIGAYTL